METYRQGNGHTKTISALGPTEREDGTPLGVHEIKHYLRFIKFDNGQPISQAVQLIEDANTPEYDGSFDETIEIDDHTPGIYEYWYRTVDTDGRESLDSDILTLEILIPLVPPNPPTNLIIG
jgi:hypothetical protein